MGTEWDLVSSSSDDCREPHGGDMLFSADGQGSALSFLSLSPLLLFLPETGFHNVALDVLKSTVQTRLASKP